MLPLFSMPSEEITFGSYKEKQKNIFDGKIIPLLFLVLLIAVGVLLYLYIANKNSKNEIPINKPNLGIIRADVFNGSETQPTADKKEIMYARASGKVFEKDLVNFDTNEVIGRATVAEMEIADNNGKSFTIGTVIKFIPVGSSTNSIPWFINGAYKQKNKVDYTAVDYPLTEIEYLFSKDSEWLLVLLFRSNTYEDNISYEGYLTFANEYYLKDDWEYIEKSFAEGFVGFVFDKPLLLERLYYLR